MSVKLRCLTAVKSGFFRSCHSQSAISGADLRQDCWHRGEVAMPIGIVTGTYGLLILATLISGYFAFLHANTLAREAQTPDNDIVAGNSRPTGRRRRARRSILAVILFNLSWIGLVLMIGLHASGTLSTLVQSQDVTVQRP
jgi:hypothetical protein